MRLGPRNIGRLCHSFARVSALVAFSLPLGPTRSHPMPSEICSPAKLRSKMAHIAQVTHGPVGAAALVVEGGAVADMHGGQRFPMQSVYKLPIALAVLHQVDLGRLNLDQQIWIKPSDLMPPSRGSVIRDKYPHGTKMTVSELLDAMISVSDGTASDILLHLAGGPERVTAYLSGLGIRGVVVATSERAMAQNEQVQYRNWATPDSMAGLLRVLQLGKGLSVPSRRLLLGLMIGSTTGLDRIKGLLPVGTVVAHKTGASGTVNGVTRATNDVGLITLPDGRHLAVVVFVSDTRANEATRDAVIAKIARAAWECRARLESHRYRQHRKWSQTPKNVCVMSSVKHCVYKRRFLAF
jgi:beta-lactamase class A